MGESLAKARTPGALGPEKCCGPLTDTIMIVALIKKMQCEHFYTEQETEQKETELPAEIAHHLY